MKHLTNVFNTPADQDRAGAIARDMHINHVDDKCDSFEANADYIFIKQNYELFVPEDQWDASEFNEWFWSFCEEK